MEHASSQILGKAVFPRKLFRLPRELGLELPGIVLGVMLRGGFHPLVACLIARRFTFAAARRLQARFDRPWPELCGVKSADPGRRKQDSGEEDEGGAGCAHNVL